MKFYSELSSDLRYIMRITLSQLIIAFVISGVSYASSSNAQGILNNPVKIEQTTTTLSNILKQLEKAADVKFVYSKSVIDVEQSVSVVANNEKLANVLNQLLLPKGIKYEVFDDRIVLAKIKESESVGEALADITVTGTVTSNEGETLPGVSVKIKGTNLGVSTNASGVYSIRVPDANINGTLVFSYIGFITQEVAINGRQNINVKLQSDVKTLSEVVVVGYGTQKKSDVTGSLVSVNAETIRERPATNVLQAIQGKAAGVNVSTNVKPGEAPAVRIRGNRSINASNDPLYVVDGIPIVSALGVTSFSINDINPNDIASLEILKDASATAIYGSRGANGVVLITTKKGSRGKVSINYNSTLSLDWYKSLTEWMNGGEYIDRWRDALINGRNYQTAANNSNLNVPAQPWYPDPVLDNQKMGLASDPVAQASVWMGYEWDEFGVKVKTRPTTAEEQALGWPAQVPIYNSNNIRSYDWADDAVRTGVNQNHQISLSSGSDISRLYLAFSTNDQKGVQRDQDFKRYNINLNGDITANKWLTLGTSFVGSFSKQNYGIFGPNVSNTGSKDLYSRALDQFPYALPRDANGEWIRNAGGNINLWNPLIDIGQSKNERRASAAMANMFSEIKFLPWLKYRLNFGVQVRNFRNGTWTGPLATNHLTNRPNTAGQTRDENFSWVAENLLYLDRTFDKIHTVGVTLLQSAQKSRRETINANIVNATIPSSLWYDLGSNSLGRPNGYGSEFTENTLSSYMGRVNYTLMNKYLLTASGRFDGSSVLAEGNKWTFFPSFALAWKLKEESFVKDISWIDELKPRLGYGEVGNSSVPPYTSLGPLSTNPYVFGNSAAIGYLPQLVQNPDLKWEKTSQWNFGLDFAVLKSRISGSIEYYNAKTTDLIFQRPVPAVTGYVNKFQNVGSTANKGFELTLSSKNIVKRDFSWNTDFNFTTNSEKITELINGDIIASNLFIGQPTQAFYYYDHAGIWQNTTEDLAEMAKFKTIGGQNFFPGTIKVVDQNKDYKIDAADQVIRGTVRPKWTGGMTNTFKYKNFSLVSFMYARIGQTYFGAYPNSFGGIFPNGRVENNVWSFTNPNGRWPMPLMSAQTVNNYTQAMQYQKGSFVAVRNISLTYDVPQKILNKATLKNLQLNVQVLNPFIFGSDLVRLGINPDDDGNWERISGNGGPLGGTNNNTILPQSFVFGIRAGL